MRHVSLVHYAAEEIYQDGDESQNGEDDARAGALLRGLRANAGGVRANFEEIGAFFGVGAYEGGDGCCREGVGLAVEGDCGGLAARFVLTARRSVFVLKDEPPPSNS